MRQTQLLALSINQNELGSRESVQGLIAIEIDNTFKLAMLAR